MMAYTKNNLHRYDSSLGHERVRGSFYALKIKNSLPFLCCPWYNTKKHYFWFSKRNYTASFILKSHRKISMLFDFNFKQQRGFRRRMSDWKPPAADSIKGGSFMKQTTELPANRLYKSRIFAMLYQDKKELLDLYNAHQ